MTQPDPVMEFLLTRRSKPANAIRPPAPEGAALAQILTAAVRVPDHGALEPWRLLVIEDGARRRLADLVRARGPRLEVAPEKVEKSAKRWETAPAIVAVVASPKPSDKAPELEQILSAGAVCVSLVNAALATGWGAAWITGWEAFDRIFQETGLGLQKHEQVAGFIHLGSCETPAVERSRPDLARIVSRIAQ
ncbi:MAG: nitroreductase [Rhodobacter sp.]|nr:nitroreductase [Rhodobacter sp.]